MTTPAEGKPHVYVIDDNPADLVMARLLLHKEGCEPHLFEDQMKALTALEKETPDLILLDIEMPGLTGLDLLKNIRRQQHLQSVPIVMVTGKSEIDNVKIAISRGANDYIVKPLDSDIFETKLWRLLRGFKKKEKLDKEWVELMLAKASITQDVHLQIDAKVISIGEVSLTVETASPLPLNLNFYVKLPFLKELEIQLLPLSVLSCAEHGDFFRSKCNIIGLPEKELQKIRLFCQTLWRFQK